LKDTWPIDVSIENILGYL